ncbi:hypothetical protein GCM10010413_11770 [Promicromonospora sukumoe]
MDTTAMTRPFGAVRDRPGAPHAFQAAQDVRPGPRFGWRRLLVKVPLAPRRARRRPWGPDHCRTRLGVTRDVDQVFFLSGRQSAELDACRTGSTCRSRVEVYPTGSRGEDPRGRSPL